MPTFAVEIHSETTLSVVITQVWNYREMFESHGVQGGRMGATETSKGEFVRLCPPQCCLGVSPCGFFSARFFKFPLAVVG